MMLSAIRLFGLVLVVAALPAMAQELFETKAPQAFMVDGETGTILYSKEADRPVAPASLAKLMTMEVVFSALKAGKLGLQDSFYVSENAWTLGGPGSGAASMFAPAKSSAPLEALIQGVVVQSANDACIAIAEGISGSEAGFAALMTERARALGMAHSTFRNATGFASDGQVSTMRDLVTLARHIQTTYPDFYRYYSQPEFTWNKVTQKNRNPLLKMGIGADGLGTGFTKESGYALVGSVTRDGRRLFVALSGLASEAERAEEARKILDWGFRAFIRRALFAAGAVVGEAEVYGGAKPSVALAAAGPIAVFVPIAGTDRLKARIVYTGPLAAPVKKGQPVGTLKLWIDDTLSAETALFAAEDVAVGSLQSRALDALRELLIGWMR